jgi:hypothetical protein
MFAGEFNSGIKKNVTITSKQYEQYLKRFLLFSVSDVAFWEWPHILDKDHPAFNLTKIMDMKIHPNNNFENLFGALGSSPTKPPFIIKRIVELHMPLSKKMRPVIKILLISIIGCFP